LATGGDEDGPQQGRKVGRIEPRLRIVGTCQDGVPFDARPLPGTAEGHGDLGSGPQVGPLDRAGGDEGKYRPAGMRVVDDPGIDQG
jgi:hypothetical protein